MRLSSLRYRLLALVTLGAIILGSCTACSPGYVMRGAYEQGKILLARRDIQTVLVDPEVSAENKEKLSLVLSARDYATRMGLNPGGAFTSYAQVSRDPLAWVVVASRRDAFALHTWWFPIVGTVPYKGFFDKDDAEAQVKELELQGYEVSMRGTEAFSTLGWFDDPVVSTTLKNSPTRIANTVIHESVHSTVWIPGGVAFNESLANFVGCQGAEAFFAERFEACRAAGGSCELEAQQLTAAKREYAFQLELAEVVDVLYNRLDQLYRDSALSSDQKIARRVGIFAEVMSAFRAKYPSIQILKEVNNADIIQLKLYLSKLWLFHELFARQGRDWGAFMGAMRRIQNEMSSRNEGATKDPFILLQDIVGTHS